MNPTRAEIDLSRLAHNLEQVREHLHLGAGAMAGVTRAIRAVLGKPFPQWSAEMPHAAKAARPATAKAGASAVYFPACISRTMGALPGEPDETSLAEAFVAVASRAGAPVWIPEDVEGTYCGVPFSSKGYTEANTFTVNRAIERFWEWSDGGRLPVVVDTSPRTYGVKASRPNLTPENQAKFDALTILDGVAFTHDTIDAAQGRIEFDAVEDQRPLDYPGDVAQVEDAMTVADLAIRLALQEVLMQLGVLGLAPGLQAIEDGPDSLGSPKLR